MNTCANALKALTFASMDKVYTAAALRDMLRRAQARNKWTDADAARAIGVLQSTVSRFMAGAEPKDATRAKIAKACQR